jgi:NADH dehydrogenase/NADH:ubiquinone oxidoreductase subunit G
LHFTGTLAYTKRGTHAMVGTSFYRSHLESDCTFCGACVEVCPTGTLSEKTRKWDGLAERETASTCPLCSIGCQINLLSKKERVIGSLPNRTRNGEEGLCVKGRFGITELVNHPTRLKHPQKRIEQTWLGIGWEEAIEPAAEKLPLARPNALKCKYRPAARMKTCMWPQNLPRSHEKREYSHHGPGQLRRPEIAAARLLQKSNRCVCPKCICGIMPGFEDKYAQSVVEVQLNRAKNQGVKMIALGARRLPWSSHMDVWLQSNLARRLP